MTQVSGILYIIAAASGSGKTSLAKSLSEAMPRMRVSISHTTRKVRNGEKLNHSYFFVDLNKFEEMIKNNEFLEFANVFGDYYGTSASWVKEQLNKGIDVILDIDWQGALQIRTKMPCISIFILPPSREELRNRLEKRKRDDSKVIEERLALASSEILHYSEFDYIVINDKFDDALSDLQAIVKSERLRLKNQQIRYKNLIDELVKNN